MCSFLGVKKLNTIVYHPESNGLVERVNRKVLEALRLTVGGYDANWDLHLSQIQLIINSNIHNAIGISPHEALYGQPARNPFHILPEPKTVSDPVNEMLRNSKLRHQILKEKLERNNVLMKSKSEKAARNKKVYSLGDQVFVKANVRKGLNYKLTPKFLGPYIITKVFNATKFEVTHEEDPSDIKVVHLQQLRF